MNKINDEVLAAISAAVSSYNTKPGFSLVVRSYKKVKSNSSLWSTTGRLERMSRNTNS